MARRTAVAALLVAVAAHVRAEEACPNVDDPMLSIVTDISPQCFWSCPEMCAPLDELVNQYLMTFDANDLKAKVCAASLSFHCVFRPENMEACSPVLAAGSSIGIDFPRSQQEFGERCVALGGGAEEADSTSASSFTATSPSTSSVAATMASTSTTPASAQTTASSSLRQQQHHDAPLQEETNTSAGDTGMEEWSRASAAGSSAVALVIALLAAASA